MGRDGGATAADFERLDIRVGRVLEAALLEGARRAAYRLRIDFGAEIGERSSSAQLTELYGAGELEGRLVLAVVNLPAKRVAGFVSEVLVLGVYASAGSSPEIGAGRVALVSPDERGGVGPGDRLG